MAEPKTRRRGAVLERAILDAAWAELSELGWSGFSIDGVAARSGAAKTVIYRRWRDRGALVQHLLNQEAANQPALASSGDLRTDLVTLVDGMCAFLRGPFGDAIHAMAADEGSQRSPSVFGNEPVVLRLQQLVDDAVDRGDLRAKPPPLAVNLGHAVVMWEFVATGSPPAPADVEKLVDLVWLPTLRAGA